MAVWRRVQFGRFTRGDRKLLAKGYAAFWIVELVTVVSFIIVYCWMSWGPIAITPRYFLMPRRGLLLEFICYSYLLFLTYFIKFNIRWNTWKFQFIISLFIIMILSYLLWRDILILITKETIIDNYGSRWRNIKLDSLIYSLSHEWWLLHTLGRRTSYFTQLNLLWSLEEKKNALVEFIIFTGYESDVFINTNTRTNYLNRFYFSSLSIISLDSVYTNSYLLKYKLFFYPRRVGFIAKRIAIWEFLLFLKIWHQLIILWGWVMYLFKLQTTKFSSYQITAVCYFNIYCCYILSLFIFFINYIYILEIFLKFRPGMFSWNYIHIYIYNFFLYCLYILKISFIYSSKEEIMHQSCVFMHELFISLEFIKSIAVLS